MAMKWVYTIIRFKELVIHHQIQFNVTQDSPWGSLTPLQETQSAYSKSRWQRRSSNSKVCNFRPSVLKLWYEIWKCVFLNFMMGWTRSDQGLFYIASCILNHNEYVAKRNSSYLQKSYYAKIILYRKRKEGRTVELLNFYTWTLQCWLIRKKWMVRKNQWSKAQPSIKK